MKRTLERELKFPEIAEKEAVEMHSVNLEYSCLESHVGMFYFIGSISLCRPYAANLLGWVSCGWRSRVVEQRNVSCDIRGCSFSNGWCRLRKAHAGFVWRVWSLICK